MKFQYYWLVLIVIVRCENLPKNSLDKYVVPTIIIKKGLAEKYNEAKWAIYAKSMADSVVIDSFNNLISCLELDLGGDNKVDVETTYFINDTVQTIFIFPAYKGKYVDNFDAIKKTLVYGASFKNDTIKYMPKSDTGFLECNKIDINIESNNLILFLKRHRDGVNPWLIDYALSKGYIDRQ